MDWSELFIVICVAYSIISWFTKIIKFISIHFRDICEDKNSAKERWGEIKEYNMTQEEIIGRIREEIDKINLKYEGHPLIEKEDIMGGFEDIINDFYEEKSPF